MRYQEWAEGVAAKLRAAQTLAEFVAQIIDYHQGYRPDMPHADLEQLGGAVHTIIGKRTHENH